jgi:tetratricopeptide (TPR) repeat protein
VTVSRNGRSRASLRLIFWSTGEHEKASQTYELWIANYPRDYVPHFNLGTIYSYIGQYEKSLAEFQEALRLVPGDVLEYANLGSDYISLNQLDKAKTALDQALDGMRRSIPDHGWR